MACFHQRFFLNFVDFVGKVHENSSNLNKLCLIHINQSVRSLDGAFAKFDKQLTHISPGGNGFVK